ncbi:MAG: hypothetical protein N2C12_00710 [Planctomycetales bacterium]
MLLTGVFGCFCREEDLAPDDGRCLVFSPGVVARDCRAGALVVADSRCLLLVVLRCGCRLETPFVAGDLVVPRLVMPRFFVGRDDSNSVDGSLFLSPPVYVTRFDRRLAF